MIKLEFNVNEVNLLLAALAKQPFEVSSELIFKIRAQAQPQVQQEQQQEQVPAAN